MKRPRKFPVALRLCMSLFLFAVAHQGMAEKKLPNFVFFLVDDLGWGDLGCYGSEFHETPHLDKLTSEGMKFTNAYSACTVCSPSRAAIELDDASHCGKRQMEKDKFKDETFSASGIPLIRFPAQATYTPADVVGKIDAAFGR